MNHSTVTMRPLCVDLDGTLIQTDTMQDLILWFLRKKFWKVPMLLIWLVKGRAYFKQRLARESVLQVELLPQHPEFLRYLVEQSSLHRPLLLVSAADQHVVQLVANHFKLFNQVIGSDGKINLRGEAKQARLVALFGAKGFDYAGNSSMDYPVWREAEEAIVVNASDAVLKEARSMGNVSKVFPPVTKRSALWRGVWQRTGLNQSRKF